MSLHNSRYLFCVICHSKTGEKLGESGSTSYSCLRDQFKKKLVSLGYTFYTAYESVEQQEQQTWLYLIGSSSRTGIFVTLVIVK